MECSEKVEIPEVNMLPELTLVSAKAEDIPLLLELRKETMSEYLEKTGSSVSEASLMERLLYRFDLAQLIYMEDNFTGMIKVQRDSDLWTIVQIQISPPFQGKGIASCIISDLVTSAHEASADISLNVLKVNPARLLYERLGFTAISESEDSFYMFNKMTGPCEAVS